MRIERETGETIGELSAGYARIPMPSDPCAYTEPMLAACVATANGREPLWPLHAFYERERETDARERVRRANRRVRSTALWFAFGRAESLLNERAFRGAFELAREACAWLTCIVDPEGGRGIGAEYLAHAVAMLDATHATLALDYPRSDARMDALRAVFEARACAETALDVLRQTDYPRLA